MSMDLSRIPSASRPSPLDVAAFLPYASAQLQADYSLRVSVQLQEEYVSKADEKSKPVKAKAATAPVQPSAMMQAGSRGSESGSAAARPGAYQPPDELVVEALHDLASGALTELSFSRELPRLLVQIVALCAPFHPLLARLAARRCKLDVAALHEVGKLVSLSHLTDVCLDDAPTAGGDHCALLAAARLQRLSLARCDLGDGGCVALAAALEYPRPASHSLRALTLTSNEIGNAGARALAAALRSNRTLMHLDLAGNRVSDEGACALLSVLHEFPLTYDELMDKRRRSVEYLRARRDHYERCLVALRSAPPPEDTRLRRRRTAAPSVVPFVAETLEQRAAAMAEELAGAYNEPFESAETAWRAGWAHSLGNAQLCSLNMAHNHLSYRSLAALERALRAQAAAGRAGLLRVQLDGNWMPSHCALYDATRALLDGAVALRLARAPRDKDKKLNKKPRM